MRSWTRGAAWVVVLVFAVSAPASAQFVILGKKVVGKISSLSQPRDAKTVGHEAATVILEADAAKVYATAFDLLSKNTKLAITKRDDAGRTLAFRNGDWESELQVTELGDHLCQILVIASAGPGQGTGPTLEALKRICDEMGVKYTLE